MKRSGILEVILLGLTLCAVISLSIAHSLMVTWIALEWLAFLCALSFVLPKASLITNFLSRTVSQALWPESRYWLWVLAIALNLIAIAETLRLKPL
ncbi:hypothetical protein ACCI51_03320 [Microbulbifer echini]|uniref:Uncharacterized protein n=1 Tax=Microbulbifer echini TaxID=1529067 RepID=A0ABV4NJF5_9GAMM